MGREVKRQIPVRRSLEFGRRDASLLAKIATEISGVFKTERMGDLFDGEAGIDQIALRLAYQLIVEEQQG